MSGRRLISAHTAQFRPAFAKDLPVLPDLREHMHPALEVE